MLAPEKHGNEVLDLAIALYARGDAVKAAGLFRTILQDDPAHAVANYQLGLLAFAEGDLEEATHHLQRAAAANPLDAEYHNNLGAAFTALNEDEDAIRAYRRALEIDPNYIEARDNLDLACAGVAPAWHFPMMADAARNDAYDRALRRAAPGRRVLDIGAGSGLLAMMAARAGAAKVTTCEMVPAIAAAAREIIEANGFTDRITLHAKRSDQLTIGCDLWARANVLVTETFCSGLLTEGVLPTIEHAREHLLTPDAIVIPRRAAARGYLIGGSTVEAQAYATHAAGFDLSRFNLFASSKFGLHLDRLPHDVLSDDFEILSFDLMQSHFPPERHEIEITVSASGRCVGVAQWLRLDLDEETSYENRPEPSAGANGWMHVVHRFAQPIELRAGDEVRLIASHTRTNMTVALAALSKDAPERRSAPLSV